MTARSHSGWLLLLLILTCEAAFSEGGVSAQPLPQSMREYRCPDISFQDAPITTVMDCLRETGRSDELHTILVLGLQGVALEDIPLITFAGKDLSVYDALVVGCTLAHLDYKMQGRVFLMGSNLSPPGVCVAKDATNMLTRITNTTLPEVTFRSAGMDAIVGWLNEVIPEIDRSGGPGFTIKMSREPREGKEPVVTIEGRYLSLLEMLTVLTQVVPCECYIRSGDILIRSNPTVSSGLPCRQDREESPSNNVPEKARAQSSSHQTPSQTNSPDSRSDSGAQ